MGRGAMYISQAVRGVYFSEILSLSLMVKIRIYGCTEKLTFKTTCFATTECKCGFVNLLLLMMMMTAGCHGDQYDQPASRMMVFRDLPDGVEPNHPQHFIIRTGYEVLFLSSILLSLWLLF